MTKRRLSVAGREQIRRFQLSAIAIVLDAQSIQRPNEEEFFLSIEEVAKMSGVPLFMVRRIGVDYATVIEVPDRVVGYARGTFYVADDAAAHRRRHPEAYVVPDA